MKHLIELNTNFSSLFLMFIKDFRVENSIHQGFFANAANRSPSNWSKIENGQTTLSFDTVYSICHALNFSPSNMMEILEKIRFDLSNRGYYFFSGVLDSSDDVLLSLIIDFYNSDGFKSLVIKNNFRSILQFYNGFNFDLNMYPDVIRYCTEPEFHQWVISGATGLKPTFNFQKNMKNLMY